MSATKKAEAPTSPGLRARNPNTSVGAAIHRDLYKFTDTSAERAGIVKEARTLAYGFWVVFCLVIGGISFSLNGFWVQAPVVAFGEGGEGLEVSKAEQFALVFPDGTEAVATRVDDLSKNTDDVAPADRAGLARVRLVSGRTMLADLYAPKRGSQQAKGLRFLAVGDKVIDGQIGRVHAWRAAKLARTVPTRYLVLAGLVLGLVCMIPPLGVPFYKVWMKVVVAPLGWLNTSIVLTLLFTILFTPAGIWLWLRRKLSPHKDALERAPKPAKETYWSQRPERDAKHFKRWF